MAPLHSDDVIAMVLGKLGRKTGKGSRWTSTRVRVARRKYCKGIKNSKTNKNVLTIAQVQHHFGVSKTTIMRLIDENLLEAEQVVPYAPYAIEKSALDSELVVSIIAHLKKTGKLVLEGGDLEKQELLFQ